MDFLIVTFSSIRTFCHPDTVIAKQLLDAQSIFNLLGCSETQQIQLAEVIQFFKVILEREQRYHRLELDDHRNGQGEQWCGDGTTTNGSQTKIPICTNASMSVAEYGPI